MLPDVRSQGRNNMDFSLFRQVAVGERVRLQLRAQAFNAFKRPKFDVPNTAVTNASFGAVTAHNNLGGELQLAVKVLW